MHTDSKKKEFVVEGYIVKDNKVLLMHHTKLNMWLPPGGHIEETEIPEEAIVREIREETGLNVEVIKRINPKNDYGVDILSQPEHIQIEDIKGTHYHIDLIYLCRVVGGDLQGNIESKSISFFTASEIENLETVPKEVKYFSKLFINRERDRKEYKLPVLESLVRKNKVELGNISLLVVQHIKHNTIEFIKLLKEAGFKSITVIGKPYSVDHSALEKIKEHCEVIIPSYDDLESLHTIKQEVNKVVSANEKFICLDLGGYFSKYFQEAEVPTQLVGVIEDTKNGIWFSNEEKLKFPLLSVASSRLKNYAENYFVARAVIRNSENIILNDFQRTLNGKRILVLGYGAIGRSIAKIARREAVVYIYDKNPIKLLKAKTDGFVIKHNLEKIAKFDVIIGITGDVVLFDELGNLKNGVILINGSTGKKEFDVKSINNKITNINTEKTYTEYTLRNGKKIYLLAHGYPINFFGTESVPEFILDMVFSEIFISATCLLTENMPAGFYPIETFFENKEKEIARVWLDYWD